MAVEDKYADANIAAGRLANPALVQGAKNLSLVSVINIAAADDNLSVYRIGTINGNLILDDIRINNTAITGGTDYELGFYKPGLGSVEVDKDILLGTVTMASARANGSELNGMPLVDQANLNKKIYELLGHTVATKLEGYDLCLTANVAGTVAGTVTVRARFTEG